MNFKSAGGRGLALGIVMIFASGLALVARPSARMAERRAPINLETAVPVSFGDWRVDTSIVPIAVSPDVQAKLDKIYNQTLSRTYINPVGQRIMLSIAYGGDQSNDESQVHRPEYCYTAQGFQVRSSAVSKAVTGYGELTVRRLLAVQGSRSEPITYWITIGDSATLPGVGRKLAQIAYGLKGTVPDGVLVRVSSIDESTDFAYGLQDQFVAQMLKAVDPDTRLRIAGRFGA
jgi:EpsI family protein